MGATDGRSVERLRELLELECEAVRLYDRVLPGMDLPGPADQVAQFRNEHRQHVEILSESLDRLGAHAERPSFDPAARYEPPGSPHGTRDGLHAARRIETRTGLAWTRVRSRRLPPAIAALAKRFHADERRHLRFVEALIDRRVWERAALWPELSPSEVEGSRPRESEP